MKHQNNTFARIHSMSLEIQDKTDIKCNSICLYTYLYKTSLMMHFKNNLYFC